MNLSRRGFFKAAGAATAATLAFQLTSRSQAYAVEASPEWKLVNTEEYTNICCYCAGGCGIVVSTRDGELVNVEGDPDHPLNLGSLCPKGATMFQLRNVVEPDKRSIIKNPNRRTKPLVRRPGKADWEDISWDQAVEEIAQWVKKTRDETFETQSKGITVNRCPGMASLGGSQQNSEEEYLIFKMMRSLGIVAIDNQARVCHSPTVFGLAATFGRGSMTNHWCDLQNADVILNIGSNCVENHPISSKWLERAHDRGATWIVVDPRYTRTAELADIYCPIRSGTDIAFYGGLFNYIFENEKWQKEYVLNYTNASYLLDEGFKFDPESGVFSGFNDDSSTYDNATWHYQTEKVEEWDTSEGGAYAWASKPGVPAFTPPKKEVPKRDMTLQDPMCVFQQMKKHYARYDLDTVASICGTDKALLEKVYEVYSSTGAPDKSGSLLYALGQTQHHYGSQNCRSMSILQLLLGNIGVAGGGLNALRGEPNVQGATDMGMLVTSSPGYLNWPTEYGTPSLRRWCEKETYSDGYYTNKPKFMVSALKEWWGDAATVENDYGYDWWPKIPKTPDFSIISTFELMSQNVIKGYWLWGMNPCSSAPNASNVRRSMAKLDWLVVADWVETESATFWKAPDMNPAEINTTVFYLPAALIYEKPGVILNSGRCLQWRFKALEPWDQSKPDYEICDLLWTRIVDLYKTEGGVCPEPILNTKWDYYVDGKIDPRPVNWGLNGYKYQQGGFTAGAPNLLQSFSELQADGSTACSMWIYTGFWCNNEAPLDPTKQAICRRNVADPSGLGLYSEWAYVWPANRRIIYNRASCDLAGKPWNEDRKLVEWTGEKWDQVDVPDFVAAKNGTPVAPNDKAFMMLWEQNARLESYTMNDGPLPEHYEPFESPATNKMNALQNSPCIRFADLPSVKRGTKEEYPIAVTTYSITEHWQTGSQTRSCPALVEAAPDQFVEMSVELAEEKGIKNGDTVRVFNNRGSVEVMALVTPRFKPFMVNGETVHQVGMIHHFGWSGDFATGDVVNDLAPNVGDPNTWMPEYKAFLVNIEKA